MCFSSEASLISLITGLTGAFMVFSLGTIPDKIIGINFSFVSLMQAIDYLLWNHQICDTYNRVISTAGMILNHMQPIVLGTTILCLNKYLHWKNQLGVLFILLCYLCIIVPYSYEFFTNEERKCTKKDSDNHLHWNWNYMNYYQAAYATFIATMFLLWFYGLPMKFVHNSRNWYDIHVMMKQQFSGFYITPSMGMILGISSVTMFYTTRFLYGTNDVGALWCFYSVFLPIIYFIIRKTFLSID
jgi:hypothetical protein